MKIITRTTPTAIVTIMIEIIIKTIKTIIIT